ncbi:MAG: endonuclease III [Erysipelotrichaceae bacterium]|nr:endonuclease III [Erysipelotrichaceae bacterium]
MKKDSKLIIDSLELLYPDAHCELVHRSDYELLIAVILSAQTTDERVNSVTPSLFKKYKDARALSKADLKSVEDIIKPIGIYKNKAKNIIETAKQLVKLHNGQVPNDRKALEELPGVGRKTANIILNNCFEFQAFAVDTHVSRVSRRLGIASESDDVREIEEKLMAFFPEKYWGKLHHQFIFFGRYKCKAVKPLCEDCPLTGICILKKNGRK